MPLHCRGPSRALVTELSHSKRFYRPVHLGTNHKRLRVSETNFPVTPAPTCVGTPDSRRCDRWALRTGDMIPRSRTTSTRSAVGRADKIPRTIVRRRSLPIIRTYISGSNLGLHDESHCSPPTDCQCHHHHHVSCAYHPCKR